MADATALLDQIPKLLEARDAAALVEHRDHADKKVRKAIRKALHTLKSKGVEIPEPSKSWSTGDSLQKMRGDLEPTAHVDARSTPGALRFLLSIPHDTEGARLFSGAITPDDRVADFNGYQQTDGQRARLLRDWERQTESRAVSVEWIKSRVRWAREQTIAAGYQVPRALDQALSLMGDTPAERPASTFLADALSTDAGVAEDAVDSTMIALGVPNWPPMITLDSMLEKAAEIHGDKPQPEKEEDRLALLAKSVEGDDEARKGLKGTLANALDDLAVHCWLEGEKDQAQAAYGWAHALRSSDTPETLDFAPRLLGYQVASLLRAMGGPEAVARAQAQAAAQGA